MTDRTTWDRRHAENAPLPAVSPFVARHARRHLGTGPGLCALDLACGSGRHAAFLSELGFRAIATDFSSEALRNLGARRTGALRVCAAAEALPFGPESFDLIVQTLFLERELLPHLGYLLRPGGLLIAETFTVAQFEATGHPRRAYCVEPGEFERLADSSLTPLELVDRSYRNDGDDDHPRHLGGIAARRS